MRRWHLLGIGFGLTLIGIFGRRHLMWLPGSNPEYFFMIWGGYCLGYAAACRRALGADDGR